MNLRMPAGAIERGEELRPLAELRMLHSLAAKLNRLNDVQQIGDAITTELGTLIDYHSCRVYLLQADGRTLAPVAFRGELTEYAGETFEDLVTHVGEGITGQVALTGETFYTPNAMEVEWAVQIPGTPDIDESMLAVPLKHGDLVTGVVVLSKLGVDQFDADDRRVLEVLASHAATAFENARLLEREREAAQTSTALLSLSQALTRVHEPETVLGEALAAIPALIACSSASAYVRDRESGSFRLARWTDLEGASGAEPEHALEVPADVAARFLHSMEEPFVLPTEVVAQVPADFRVAKEPRPALVAPLRWEPDGFGAIVMLGPSAEASFTERDLRLARGIADITSLALGNARRIHELERFHELVESLDAVFWEADPDSLQITFLSRRAEELLGKSVEGWMAERRRWGDHVQSEDRARVDTTCRELLREGRQASLEYRATGPTGEPVWLRDQVQVVRDARGSARLLRGLMVDITERKRAEEALQRSERKFSEAFHRERQATQRLRALDEMKNTFLEAVSHDLRTPLTSILGSAVTLEQSGLDLPRRDALDLVGRIVANARKLERLLSDLLDLDRLQRGIVAPQRRPTDVAALVGRVVEESEVVRDHRVELDLEPATVAADAAKLERIVENLLANASRHTPSGTQIWVRTCQRPEGALICVDDAGPGVPPEIREAIFEPFSQGTEGNHAPGVGIGLSLVRRFAELHGGRAWVEERPGGGASFRVLVPS